MKKHLHKLILFSATACLSACTAQEPLTDYVDPRIGTAHSRWFFFTPAAVPFGMAKLAPTTDGHLGNPNGWEAVGYDSRHTSIEGFANFHEFQVGGVVVAPTVGELQTVPGPLDNPDAGYRSRFDKKDEVARPRLLLRAAEGLRRQGRADSHRTGRIPPLYLPGDGGGEPDLQHRDAHGRKRPGARRVGDLHRRRTYRGLGGDRARLCRHLPERRHGDNVFQRRTRRRACGLGRVQRRANLRGGAQPHRRRSRALPAFRHPRASAGGAEDRPVVHVGGERAAEPRKGGRQERFRPGAPRGERHVGRGARPASRRGRPAR